VAGGLPALPANCAPCQQLQSTLQNCQACGQNCGTCTPAVGCPAGEHPQPCAINEVIDPNTGCCEPYSQLQQCPCGGSPTQLAGYIQNACGCWVPPPIQQGCPQGCPAGDYTLVAGTPCPAGTAFDPSSPAGCNCCKPTLPIGPKCAANEHPQPCLAGEVVDPQTQCCEPGTQLQSCPCGGSPTPLPGYIQNSCGCWAPAQLPPQCTCPAGDYNLPVGTPCPTGTQADPMSPAGCNCCRPIQAACPPGDTPQPCQTGYAQDPQFPSCCKPEPVEACIVCPGGLPDLAAALSGGQNGCYLYSQQFLPFGALPAPGAGGISPVA